MKIRRRLQSCIEKIPPQIKGARERRLPVPCLRIDQRFQSLATCVRLAPILNLQALAVVRHHGEKIGSGSRLLCRPQRLQQAQSQRRQPRDLERHTHPAQPAQPRRRAIAPRQRERRHDEKAHRRPKPLPS